MTPRNPFSLLPFLVPKRKFQAGIPRPAFLRVHPLFILFAFPVSSSLVLGFLASCWSRVWRKGWIPRKETARRGRSTGKILSRTRSWGKTVSKCGSSKMPSMVREIWIFIVHPEWWVFDRFVFDANSWSGFQLVERCYSLSCAFWWVGFEFGSVCVLIRILGQGHSTRLLRRRRSLQTRPGSPSNRCRRGLPVGGPTIAADLGRGNPRMRIPLMIQWKVRLSFLCLPPGW